jgi:putative hydrolase of the HAD superfamily
VAAVVFDLDDTLYPHIRYVHSAFAAVARHLGGRFGLTVDDVYGSLRRASEAGYRGQEFQRVCAIYGLHPHFLHELVGVARTHEPNLQLSYDALEAIDAVRRRGWRTAILTNGLPAVQAAKVRALGLEMLVDHVVYADHYNGGKPAAEAFLETLRRLHVAPDRAVMVGNDRINDIGGARAVGLRTVLVSRSGHPQTNGGADVVVDQLTDVPWIATELVAKAVAYAA